MNVGRAVDFDEGEILVGLAAGLILAGVAHQVGEDGHVVGDFSADGDGDGFAASMVDIGGQACTISEGEDAKKDEKVTKGHLVFVFAITNLQLQPCLKQFLFSNTVITS